MTLIPSLYQKMLQKMSRMSSKGGVNQYRLKTSMFHLFANLLNASTTCISKPIKMYLKEESYNTVIPAETTASYLIRHSLLEAPNYARMCYKYSTVMKQSRKRDEDNSEPYVDAPKKAARQHDLCSMGSHYSF